MALQFTLSTDTRSVLCRLPAGLSRAGVAVSVESIRDAPSSGTWQRAVSNVAEGLCRFFYLFHMDASIVSPQVAGGAEHKSDRGRHRNYGSASSDD